MTMKVAIIGGLGVGVAHVLAASKIESIKHIDVYDINPAIRDFYTRPTIKNEWGTISDKIKNPGIITPIVSDSITKFDYDLIIIATPNDTHLHLLKEAITKSKKVLVEKPMVDINQIRSLNNMLPIIGNCRNKIFCGFEWLYHDEMRHISLTDSGLYYKNKIIKRIKMIIGYAPESVKDDLKFGIIDLGIHLLSILRYKGLKMPTENITVTNVGMLSVCKFNDYDFEIEVGYDESLIGGDCGIVVEFFDNTNLSFDWVPFTKGDLFYKQMKNILFKEPSYQRNLFFKDHINILKQLRLWYHE